MYWRHYLSQQLLLHAEQQNLLPTMEEFLNT